MSNYVFVDTILRVYESDGNLHVIGGLANGEVDVKGKDIIEKSLHLTMPMDKAIKIIPEIANALPKLNKSNVEIHSINPGQKGSDDQIEGQGLHFKIKV